MSILVTTTNTGTPRASARPRCSGEEGGGGEGGGMVESQWCIPFRGRI